MGCGFEINDSTEEVAMERKTEDEPTKILNKAVKETMHLAPQADERWDLRRKTGLNDDEMLDAVRHELLRVGHGSSIIESVPEFSVWILGDRFPSVEIRDSHVVVASATGRTLAELVRVLEDIPRR